MADEFTKFRVSELANRQTSELIGFARGILADGYLNDAEVEQLFKWLVASEAATTNPLILKIRERIEEAFEDGFVDEDERADLSFLLEKLVRSDFEIGEVLKSTSLPLCDPAPGVIFDGKLFCFTGTFAFGKRQYLEDEVAMRGGSCAGLSGKTDFLVIGEYATDSWVQSSFGRKIEKAVVLKDKGNQIKIISEAHWRNAL